MDIVTLSAEAYSSQGQGMDKEKVWHQLKRDLKDLYMSYDGTCLNGNRAQLSATAKEEQHATIPHQLENFLINIKNVIRRPILSSKCRSYSSTIHLFFLRIKCFDGCLAVP